MLAQVKDILVVSTCYMSVDKDKEPTTKRLHVSHAYVWGWTISLPVQGFSADGVGHEALPELLGELYI